MLSKLEQAKEFIKQGIAVIPLHHRSKVPDTSLTNGAWEQFQDTLTTEYQASQWLGSGWLNYGVVCGWNNLVVIDFDDIEYFDLWQLYCSTRETGTQYVAAESFKVRTRRGMHVYIRTQERVENSKRRNIDIQAQGKYVVGPGSVHPSGHVYEPIGELVFPIVFDLEEILPLDLFPPVAASCGSYSGAPVEFKTTTTEYQYDPFAAASMGADVDLLTKVKSSVRIESLFADLRKTSTDGRWLATKCLFHDDNHPSMWIDTARQLCGCNVCGMKPMDVVNLYARMHKVSESAAVAAMAESLGVWK